MSKQDQESRNVSRNTKFFKHQDQTRNEAFQEQETRQEQGTMIFQENYPLKIKTLLDNLEIS